MPMKFVIAPGWVKDLAEVKKFSNVAVSEIVAGSFTPLRRDDMSGGKRNFHHTSDYRIVLNSIQLRNPGLPAFLTWAAEAISFLKERGIELRVSVAGFCVDDYIHAAGLMYDAGIMRWEFNWGCPNGFAADGTAERIMSFDLDAMAEILAIVETTIALSNGKPWVAVKLSPYSDPQQLKDIAQMLNGYEIVSEVVASNTFPNCSAYESDGTPFIGVADGYAGLSGGCMRSITIGQVRQFKKYLKPEIEVGAAGGVESGWDVRDYELAGASSVYIGAIAFMKGPRAVSHIMREYADLTS
jgi:dihydroorotate dehydrogenase